MKKARSTQPNKDYEALFDEVIVDIAEKGLSVIPALKGRMSTQKFYELLEDESKAKKYARACEMRAETMADETLTIADNFEHDVINEDGKILYDNALINRDRLRVDTRKWLLAKLHPKKYGDKIDVGMTGNITLNFDKDDEKA